MKKSRNNLKVELKKALDDHLLELERIQQEYASFISRSDKSLMQQKVKVIFFSPVTGDKYEENCTEKHAEDLIEALETYGAEYKVIS